MHCSDSASEIQESCAISCFSKGPNGFMYYFCHIMLLHVYVCMYVYIYIYLYLSLSIYIYIYTYIILILSLYAVLTVPGTRLDRPARGVSPTSGGPIQLCMFSYVFLCVIEHDIIILCIYISFNIDVYAYTLILTYL